MPHPGWCLVTTRSAPGSDVVFCPLHWKLSLIDLSFRALPTLAILDYVLILTFSHLKQRCRNQFEYFAIASFASTITSADISYYWVILDPHEACLVLVCCLIHGTDNCGHFPIPRILLNLFPFRSVCICGRPPSHEDHVIHARSRDSRFDHEAWITWSSRLSVNHAIFVTKRESRDLRGLVVLV